MSFFFPSSCHLVLGEVENALHYYNKLLESGPDVCLDRRITIDAAEGLQKAQVSICLFAVGYDAFTRN